LLETVIATGLLVLGLAVIGAQVQDADTTIRRMQLHLEAMRLAEATLAELDLGLVELDSIDEEQEEEYGSRYPDFGWRLTTEETAIDQMYLLRLEVLYLPQETQDYGDYREGNFDFDAAETLLTIYAMRPNPEPVDLAVAFGLNFEEMEESEAEEPLTDQCECLNGLQLDMACWVDLPLEELTKCFLALSEYFGREPDEILPYLPPELLELVGDMGLTDEGEEEEP
jgi:hypothetical protein